MLKPLYLVKNLILLPQKNLHISKHLQPKEANF